MKIAITLGDPMGIGPEVIQKALKKLGKAKGSDVIVYGEFTKTKSALNAAKIAKDALDRAIDDAIQNRVQAIVTAPVNKFRMQLVIPDFAGHTEYLAKRCNIGDTTMLFAPAPNTKPEMPLLALVTRHLAISKVHEQITKENILKTVKHVSTYLKTHSRKSSPALKIAVLSLNPHAGDEGVIGDEEEKVIIPAIREASKNGINCSGPFPSDTFFALKKHRDFDAILAMYHDQGMIPVKILGKDQMVNITLGLPFVRTSPAHGTAFDIAGRGEADPSSMLNAIEMAFYLCKHIEEKDV